MTTHKSVHQPIRLSEYMNVSKSSDKKLHKPRMEPVRIKDLLLSSSKACSSSVDRPSRRTKLFAIPKKTVRRALYEKSPSPAKSSSSQSSIETKNSVSISKINTSNKKNTRTLPQAKTRQSMLPQPNFIVKKHKQKVLDDSIPAIPTVVEERLSEVINLSPPQLHERATVIKSIYSKSSTIEKNKTINDCEIVRVENDNDNNIENRLIDDLEASIVDKENIPPDNIIIQPLMNNRSPKLNDFNEKNNLDSFENNRLEKIEHDLQIVKDDLRIVKEQQSLLIEFVQKIFKTLSITCDESQKKMDEPTNISYIPSSPQIPLITVTSTLSQIKENNNNNDDKNTLNEKKRRKSLTSTEERRRSARIAAKLTPRKSDSFISLENELNIVHSTSKTSSASATPKNEQFIFKSKSARPLREYMAMKASMTFLETPDATGFRRNINFGDDTPARNKSLRRSISSKIFNELQDLYNDSEEAETSTDQ